MTGVLEQAQQTAAEIDAKVQAGEIEDPLAGVESHGGYWGFEVPEVRDAQ